MSSHSAFLRALILLLALQAVKASGASDAQPQLKLEMRRQEYVGKLKIETRQRFCAEDGMLRCFNITTDQCLGVVEQNFSTCLKNAKVPEPVPLTGLDVKIAESVGSCVGEKVGMKFHKQFKNSGECTVRK